MNNIRNKLIRDQIIYDDENNPSTSMADIIWPRTVLDAVFDQLDKDEITLRELLKDMKEEIKNNGTGYIRFPVTSVNGEFDDVVLTKDHINLGRVNNTSDMEKPLSDPQRNDLMAILANYDFGVDLTDITNHILNHNNPHQITLSQLDIDGSVGDTVNNYISFHDSDFSAHNDIREAISNLSIEVQTFDQRITTSAGNYAEHILDTNAHSNILTLKEDKANKLTYLMENTTYDDHKYPTAKAVVNYLGGIVDDLQNTINSGEYIADLDVINSDIDLPLATANMHRRAYLIKNKTGTNISAIAVCIKSGTNYYWDIQDFIVSKFNANYFTLTSEGLSIDINALPVSENIYSKTEADSTFLQSVEITPGTNNGSINYKVKTDSEIINQDVSITGLGSLAYLSEVGYTNIGSKAVRTSHINDGAVGTVQIANSAITNLKMANMNSLTIKGNMTAAAAAATDVTLASLTDNIISKMTTTQKTDLGANLISYGYQHPATHPPTIIAQNTTNRFVTDAEKTAWNGKAPGTHTHAYLPLTGGTITGNLVVNGTITGSSVFNAVWNNDIAELFEKDNTTEIYNPGDIIELNPVTGKYRKSTTSNSSLVVGIVSDRYGYLLGGDENLTLEENLKKYIPVGLAGRIFVNLVGKIKAGELITSSALSGIGIISKSYKPGCIIGKALENKNYDEIGPVEILIMNR